MMSADVFPHINFTRLQRSADAINQMLRHQMRPYLQVNASPSVVASGGMVHAAPSTTLGMSLGVENLSLMQFVEGMLATGGVGQGVILPGVVMAAGHPTNSDKEKFVTSSSGLVGVSEQWYWQRSEELQTVEVETADIRKGLEAAGF